MDLSEQALNELERNLIDSGIPPQAEISEHKVDEHIAPEHLFDHPIDNEPDSMSLRKEFRKQRNDYKQLLVSYNELSTAFRTHLSSSLNDYFTSIISDLKSETHKLTSEKKFFLHQVHSLLSENYRLKSQGKSLEDFGLNFSGIEELVFQNFYIKESMKKSINEKVVWLEKQLQNANDVIKQQDNVIEEMKKEIEGFSKDHGHIEVEKINGLEKKVKLGQAILEETKKETRLLKEKNLILAEKLERITQEVSSLRQQLVVSMEEKISLQKHRDIIIRENEYLNAISKEFEKVHLGRVLSISESSIFQRLQEENARIKQKLNVLEMENKKLLEKTLQENRLIEHEMNEQQVKMTEIATKNKKSHEKKDEEIRKLKDDILNNTQKCENLEVAVETLQKELGENLKNLKKVTDELEGIKKVTGKRVAQLESIIAVKNEEISRLTSYNSIPLSKIVLLLQKLQVNCNEIA